MAQMKTANKVVTSTVETMAGITFKLNELVAEFGSIEILKPADSYLLGAVKTVQASCNYLSDFANDLDRLSKPAIKTKMDPNMKED
ncbi:MAG: hypothetical protein ACRYGG_21905 [Janthinobacterium lividum]